MSFLNPTNILKSVWNYVIGYDEREERIKELAELKEFWEHESSDEEDFLSQAAPKTQNEQEVANCIQKMGKITSMSGSHGIIDEKYKFTTARGPNRLKTGDTVQYLAFKPDKNSDFKISKVLSVENEVWGNDEPISNADIDGLMPTSTYGIHTRSITAQVTNRFGRVLALSNGNMDCDLNEVQNKAGFIPIVGDWLVLTAIVQTNDTFADYSGETLEYQTLNAYSFAVKECYITKYDNNRQEGIADGNVFFTHEACEKFTPSVGDKVLVECFQSDQGVCHLRACTVLLQEKGNRRNNIESTDNIKILTELLKEKSNISIVSSNFRAEALDSEAEIYITVTNRGAQSHTLLEIAHFCSAESNQNQIHVPEQQLPLIIHGGDKKRFTVIGQSKFNGTSKEVVVFKFKGFEVGKYVYIQIGKEENDRQRNRRNNAFHDNSNNLRNSRFNSRQPVCPGRKPVKSAAFVANRLIYITPPQELYDAIIGQTNGIRSNNEIEESILKAAPLLKVDINMHIYTEYFEVLMHLERIYEEIQISQYNMSLGHFIHMQGFLLLEIDNLSERRPSLVVGDRAVATDIKNVCQRFEGFIHKVDSKHIWLQFNENFHSSYTGKEYAITFHCSATSYMRCCQAVRTVDSHFGEEFLFPKRVNPRDLQLNAFIADKELFIKFKTLSEKTLISKHLTKNIPVNNENDKENISAECNHWVTNGLPSDDNLDTKIKWYYKDLNDRQMQTVKNILCGGARPLPYIVFGPPGTGKSKTVVEIVLQILHIIPNSKILLATPSNSSADLLTQRLMLFEDIIPGDMVRVLGHHVLESGSVPEEIMPYCATLDIARVGSRESRLTTLKSGLRLSVNKELIGKHRLTIGTCMALGQLITMGFNQGHFTHVVIDEAGQATEPEALIPISLLNKKYGQVILAAAIHGDFKATYFSSFRDWLLLHWYTVQFVDDDKTNVLIYSVPSGTGGDPMQLGPIVGSSFAEKYGLGNSLMCRMLACAPYLRDVQGFPNTGGYDPQLVTKLTINYRSLPEILKLPSDMFYDSELIPHRSLNGQGKDLLEALAEILPSREQGGPPAVVFCGVQGVNVQSNDSPSWYNDHEAGQVFYFLNKLYLRGVKSEDIGIITPYSKQVQTIREVIKQFDLDVPKIGSVEEFQGQERSIIIISTVRSGRANVNTDLRHSLGFVQSPKRLNVAITRAKNLLVIFGNPHLLSIDNNWKRVITYATSIGGYTGCNRPAFL